MRLQPLHIALSVIVAGCSAAPSAPSTGEGTSATTSSALSAAPAGVARAGVRRAKMKVAAPLARHNPLLSKGGDPGDDDTQVSLDPTVSALCQSYTGNTNVFPNPRPDVDAIRHDVITTVGSQAGCGAAQDETTIAVNPRDPWNLVAGANDYRLFNTREANNDGSGLAYTSFDGGRTWKDVLLPHLTFITGATGVLSDMDAAGDPVVAFGPRGTVYYANLVFSRINSGSGLTVSVSHDGGATWDDPSIVHTDGADASGNPVDTTIFNDKEWIAVDPRSGTVYVTWTSFGSADSPILVSSSKDEGKTWSAPVRVNPVFTPGGITAFGSGSSPQVGRDGALYIAYETAVCATLACDLTTDYDAVVVAKSTDGGQTFVNTVVAQDYDFPYNADTQRDTLTGENFRINSFPQLALDEWTNDLYVTWGDDRNGAYNADGTSLKSNGDVIVAHSTDGVTWSAPIVLGTPDDEVYPAVAAGGGHVVLSFYTRHYDPTGVGLDYASVAADGFDALATRKIHRLTTATSNPQVQFAGYGAVTGNLLQGVFIGDYTSIALGWDGVAHPSWTDFRGLPGVTPPNQDVYTRAVSVEDLDD